MHIYQTEGIILQASPYQDYHQILSVFSKDFGLIKLIYKYSLSKKKQNKGILTPLSCWEFAFTQKTGELKKCEDAEYQNGFLELRNSIEKLEAACLMAKSILQTQELEVPTPLLYALFMAYLQKLSLVQDPFILSSSFLLKILIHDGWANLQPTCSICQTAIQEAFLYQGEVFCPSHQMPNAFVFDDEEFLLLCNLAYQRSFQYLREWTGSKIFHQKILHLFTHILNHSTN